MCWTTCLILSAVCTESPAPMESSPCPSASGKVNFKRHKIYQHRGPTADDNTLILCLIVGINIFLDGYVPTENLRFRETSLVFKVAETANEEEVKRLRHYQVSSNHLFLYILYCQILFFLKRFNTFQNWKILSEEMSEELLNTSSYLHFY